MALVHKLQNGGSFNDFLEEASKDVSKNSLKQFSAEASVLKDLYNKGKLQNAFTFSDGSYQTNTPELSGYSGLSTGDVKRNLLGKIKLNSPEEARTYLAGLVQKFYQQSPTTTPVENKFTPVQLEHTILKNEFKGDTNLFGKTYASLGNKERWEKYIIPGLNNYIDYYKNLNPEQEHLHLEELGKIKELISQPNFDKQKVIDLMNKTGLNSENLLLSPEDQAKWEKGESEKEKQLQAERDTAAQATAAKREEEEGVNYVNSLKKYGMSTDTISTLYNAGFTQLGKTFKNDFLNKYVKASGLLTVYNPNTNVISIVDKYGFHNKAFTDVNARNTFGNVLTSTEKGVYYEPAATAWKAGRRAALSNSGFGAGIPARGPEVEGGSPSSYRFELVNAPGQLKNAIEVRGYPESRTEKNVTDAFKNLDYYSHLKAILPGNKEINLYKNSDGSYTDSFGNKMFLNIKDTNVPYKFTRPFNPTKFGLPAASTIDESKAKDILKNTTTGNVTQQELSSLLNWAKENPQTQTAITVKKTFPTYMKNGGTIKKFYVGGSTKFQKEVPAVKPEDIHVLKGSRLFSDFKGQGALDKAQTAADLLMLAPGALGVAGGIGSTIIGLTNDIVNKKGVWHTLGDVGANLALTGAATIGLGGAKAALKGVNILSKYSDVDKLLNIAKTLKGDVQAAKEVGEAGKVAETAAKPIMQSKYIEPLQRLKDAGVEKITAKGIEKTANPEDLAAAKELAQSLTKSDFIPKVNLNIKTWKPMGKVLSPTIAATNVALNAPTLKNIAENKITGKEEWTTDDANALASVLFGLRTAGIGIKKGLAKSVLMEPKIESPNKIIGEVKGQKVEISGPEVDKFITSKNPLKGKESIKKLIVEKYNTSAETPATIKDIESFIPQKEVISKTPIEGFDINKNYWLQAKSKKWAEKYLANGGIVEKLQSGKVINPFLKDKPVDIFKSPEIDLTQPMYKTIGKRKFFPILGKQDENQFPLDVTIGNRRYFPKLEATSPGKLDILSKKLPSTLPATGKTSDKEAINWGQMASNVANVINKNKDVLQELGLFAATNKLNRESANAQRAALATTFMPSLVTPRIVINKAVPNLASYDLAATSAQNVGRRIAESTSDVNKGIAAQLEASKRAGEIKLEGAGKSAEYLQALKDKQAELDVANQEQNLKTVYNTIAANKETAKQIALVGVNERMQFAQNLYNLSEGLKNIQAKKTYEKTFDQMANLYNNPQYKASMETLNRVNTGDFSQEKEYKEWNALSDEQKRANGETFENSPHYKNMAVRLKSIKDYIENFQNSASLAQAKWSRGIYSKGGSIEDKIALEDEKESHREKLEALKEYYKRLMKNEEYLNKAMIKIFK